MNLSQEYIHQQLQQQQLCIPEENEKDCQLHFHNLFVEELKSSGIKLYLLILFSEFPLDFFR
jgi:hypothetical protein